MRLSVVPCCSSTVVLLLGVTYKRGVAPIADPVDAEPPTSQPRDQHILALLVHPPQILPQALQITAAVGTVTLPTETMPPAQIVPPIVTLTVASVSEVESMRYSSGRCQLVVHYSRANASWIRKQPL